MSSAAAEKSKAAPPIANANTEAVPRMSFLSIIISRFAVNYQIGIQNSFATTRVLAQCVKFWTRETRCNGCLSPVETSERYIQMRCAAVPVAWHRAV